jgi:predicted permease
MRELWREFVFGFRQFRRSPGLAFSVALTIGLGVGANLAVFALLTATFLPRTPYRDAGQLVVVENTGPYFFGGSLPQGLSDTRLSFPDFDDVTTGQRSLAGFAGFSDGNVSVVTGYDRPRAVCRILVTPGLFETLGASPLSGRLLTSADFAADAPAAALVTDGLWHSHFASTPKIAGTAINLDEQPYTVVGVIPSSVFGLLQQRDGLLDTGSRDRCVVTPLVRGRNGEHEMIVTYMRKQRDAAMLRAVGRMRPGQTTASTGADFGGLGGRIRLQNMSTNAKRGLRVVPLDAWRTTGVQQLLLMLACVAALAFLVACANAAGLVLTDSVRREAELGVRQALGAGPAQLLRVVVVRAVLWALPGALLGIVFAVVTLALLRWGATAGTDQPGATTLGPLVLTAGLALTLIAGLVTGGVAAWSMRKKNLTDALREGGGLTASGGRRRHRITATLVSVQVAAATALAIGAALLVHSMWNVVSADRGFDRDRGFVVQVRLPKSKYPKGADHVSFFRQALERIRALPGVKSAGLSISPPLTDTSVSFSGDFVITTPRGQQTVRRLDGQFVTSGYFESTGSRLVRGRFFSQADDDAASPMGVVVDESFCRTYLKGVDPLASTVTFGDAPMPIVGVVADLHQATERQSAEVGRLQTPGLAYLPFRWNQRAPTWSFLVVRASANPAPVANAVVRELLAVERLACLDDPRSFAQLFAQKIAERRRILSLVGGLAGIVLLLTALSVTAALSQFVQGHARDIAIRFAVGASRRHVLLLTARHLLVALVAGLAAGVGGGFALARMLASQLYGIESADASTLAVAAIVLVVLGSTASVGPLWRASRMDPGLTLKAS